ncbi:MAG: monooxygenase [Egibacteraceae bacterium]
MPPDDRPLASLHVFTVARSGVPVALARMAHDRQPLRRTGGLRFAKLLGTGSGLTFTVRDADPRHWGLFAVWDSDAALAAFEAGSEIMRAWTRLAVERWRVDLAPLRSRGRWAGRDPFAGTLREDDGDGLVAALTRARIRWPLARTFWRAVPPVSAELHRQPGLRFALGVGEAPLGLQGTFSVWDSAAALTAFAYGGEIHREAIHRTHDLGWYAEDLFARFAVLSSVGTVDGRDPLVPG